MPNLRLASVAAYWGIRQRSAHDALDDARVLAQVFRHSLAAARQYDVPLPVLECSGRGAATYATAVPRTPCSFKNPPSWTWGAPLIQGMKVAITGPTIRPRAELAALMTAAGLDVMNNVSSQTRLVVVNDPQWTGSKIRKAREHGTAMCHEEALLPLLDSVKPGEPKVSAVRAPAKKSAPSGPWSGTRVLVLGGNHDDAAEVRARVAEYGARVLLTLGATTTHVVLLPGGEHDPRMRKIRDRRLITLTPDQLTPDGVVPRAAPSPGAADVPGDAPRVLVRGQVVDLPDDSDNLELTATWFPRSGCDVDVVAFAVGDDGLVGDDSDFVFYNAPVSVGGGIALTIDGDAEQGIRLSLDDLPPGCTRVVVAAVITGDTFGGLGPLRLDLGIVAADFAEATLDAATDESSLVLAEVYQRGERWRVRVVGRGYQDGLRQLVERYGVTVDD